MVFNCLKATEPLQGDSLLFTVKFLGVPGTHLIDLGKVKGCIDLGATQWFCTLIFFASYSYLFFNIFPS